MIVIHFAARMLLLSDSSPCLIFALRDLSVNEIMNKQTSACQFVGCVDLHDFDTARTSHNFNSTTRIDTICEKIT